MPKNPPPPICPKCRKPMRTQKEVHNARLIRDAGACEFSGYEHTGVDKPRSGQSVRVCYCIHKPAELPA